MGSCDHPECKEGGTRRLFIGESVYEYCIAHYEEASALLLERPPPQWEAAPDY